MSRQITITDEDVAFAATVLLELGESFDDERSKFIRELGSVDVQACPGSGKTTCLLAKLLLLGKHLPFEDGSGILVLSHTNAAVDEIRGKILKHCPDLFNHPNFVGTIQGFVDQFLAIPFYAHKYGHSLCWIDDDVFGERIGRLVCLPKYRGLNIWLQNQPKRDELLSNLRFNSNNELISSCSLPNCTTTSYQSLLEIKNRLLADGFLCYEDAYYFAECYLKEFSKIVDLIRKRFRFVFIDEMQDTDIQQMTLIDTLFPVDCPTTVIQRIGDQNQAIYSRRVKSENVWTPRAGFLTLNGSKRLSESISTTIKNICLNPQELVGNGTRQNIKPRIIVFDDDSIKDVPKKFGDLIVEFNLHTSKNPVFKAIGWRKTVKEDGALSIGSYFDGYQNSISSSRTEYENLKDYLTLSKNAIDSSGLSLPRKAILNGIIKTLRLCGIKSPDGRNYTVQSFLAFLKEGHENTYEDMKSKIYKWSVSVYEGTDVHAEIKEYLLRLLAEVFEANLATVPDLDVFFAVVAPQITNQSEQSASANIYHYKNDGTDIDIEIGTIHSVKGETHTGTLYLETYYFNDGGKSYESQRLLAFLKGERIAKCGTRVKESLKMAYVGMSRPRELLCFAVHKSHIPDTDLPLLAEKWEIVPLQTTA